MGKVIFSLFDLKNRFSVFNSPINIAGDRLDILFHFPNDWYNNIGGLVEKEMRESQKFNFDFFDLPLDIFVPIVRKVEKDV